MSSAPDLAAASRTLPERVTMGLLPYINAHAIDEDYAVAASRRGPATTVPARRRRVGRGGAVVLAVFAILAVTAAVQTSKDSVSEEKDRRALITQVTERRDAVNAQRRAISKLQAQTSALRSALLRADADADGVTGRLTLLGLRNGTVPAKGPGVEVVVDDAVDAANERNKVLDSDLQKLVNGLWEAGAEAISINGQRLTALSAIRFAGTAISVNFVSLQRPYRVLAIGNPDTLQGRFGATTSGAAWFDLQRDVGLRFSMHRAGSLRLPAAPVPSLRYVVSGSGTTGNGTKGRNEP